MHLGLSIFLQFLKSERNVYAKVNVELVAAGENIPWQQLIQFH